MKIRLIGAHGRNLEFGNKNDLPAWKLGFDMSRFSRLTKNSVVVMGEKCFLSLPEKYRPLPNRRNVVLTLDEKFCAGGVEVFHNIETLLEHFKNEECVWVIGGSGMYKAFLDKNLIDELYITEVDGDFEADVFFPKIDFEKFEIASEEVHEADEKNSHKTMMRIWRKK